MNFEIGDIVKLKKPHPCGSQEWEILRIGMDFRLKCLGCGHQVMVSRKLVEKNIQRRRTDICRLVPFYPFLWKNPNPKRPGRCKFAP